MPGRIVPETRGDSMISPAFQIVFPLLVIYAAVSDLFTMTIPNRVSLLLVGGFLACALLAGLPPNDLLVHAACGLSVLAVGFAMFAFRWVGGGDVKLAAATALWIGSDQLVEFLVLAALGGALTLAILFLRSLPLPAFALGWNWLSRLHDRTGGVPYGIALAAAALVVYPTTAFWKAAF
jgi:prepilin peptidase CpaA